MDSYTIFSRIRYVILILIALFLCFNCILYSVVGIIEYATHTVSVDSFTVGLTLEHYITFTIISIPLFIYLTYKLIRKFISWIKPY